jgi:hypothetical protein
MSHLDGYTDAAFLLAALTRQDVTFKVSYLNGELANVHRAASLLRSGWTAEWDVLLDIVPFDGLAEAFDHRRTSPSCKTLVRLNDGLEQRTR